MTTKSYINDSSMRVHYSDWKSPKQHLTIKPIIKTSYLSIQTRYKVIIGSGWTEMILFEGTYTECVDFKFSYNGE